MVNPIFRRIIFAAAALMLAACNEVPVACPETDHPLRKAKMQVCPKTDLAQTSIDELMIGPQDDAGLVRVLVGLPVRDGASTADLATVQQGVLSTLSRFKIGKSELLGGQPLMSLYTSREALDYVRRCKIVCNLYGDKANKPFSPLGIPNR